MSIEKNLWLKVVVPVTAAAIGFIGCGRGDTKSEFSYVPERGIATYRPEGEKPLNIDCWGDVLFVDQEDRASTLSHGKEECADELLTRAEAVALVCSENELPIVVPPPSTELCDSTR